MLIRLTDIKNPAKGAYHRQYWFTWPAGHFLSDQAVHPPYYKYLTPPGARFPRWMRLYQVSLPIGAEVCRYVQRGYNRLYIVYRLTSIEGHAKMDRIESHQGLPPWMIRGAYERPISRDN